MPTPTEYQFVIGDVTLGPGTDYIVHGVEGFGAPISRNGDLVRPRDHGSFFGLDFLSDRAMAISITVRGDDPADTVANLDALLAEWQPISSDASTTKNLTYVLPGTGVRELRGRPRRAVANVDRMIGNRIPVMLEYVASDPRQYGELTTLSVGMASVTSGRTYPRTYDLTYGGGTSGSLFVVNEGNFSTRPTFRLFGPAANPFIEELVSGVSMSFAITIANGDFLTIDTDARTVMLNDVVSRYNTIVSGSTMIELAPGTSEIRFSADTFQVAASLDVIYASAWL